MSRARDLVERMNRLSAAPTNGAAPATELSPAPARTSVGPRQRGKVRITFDLEPELHRSLRLFALEQRAAASDVVRALLELLDDPVVSQTVAERLDKEAT